MKGVKVELGIPYDLWDKPSAEITKMHRAVSVISVHRYSNDEHSRPNKEHMYISFQLFYLKNYQKLLPEKQTYWLS